MQPLKGVAVGAGFFSQFHLEAWQRIEGVRMAAVCDVNAQAAASAAARYGIAQSYTDLEAMLDAERPDFVDVITRPETHLPIVQAAADRGIAVICQKALAPDQETATRLVDYAEAAGVPLMVHENFRFQPWYRELRRQIEAGAVGDRLHGISFRCRTGDGWQGDAYLDRQPYFRQMPRLMVFETGVHFVDTYRYLLGEIESVYAKLRQWNAEIAGEDAALILFEFDSGATGLWDGNRFNEPAADDARYTFGEALVEGNEGSIRLETGGELVLQRLGQPPQAIEYCRPRRGFAGDCVHATQQHFVDGLRRQQPFETSGREYLKTLNVVEAIYQSATEDQPVRGLARGTVCK